MRKPTAKRLIRELKERFNEPHKAGTICIEDNYPEGSYCVGGAFMLAKNKELAGDHLYPSEDELGELLCEALKLDSKAAHKIATKIVDNNDAGSFEKAWKALEKAFALSSLSTLKFHWQKAKKKAKVKQVKQAPRIKCTTPTKQTQEEEQLVTVQSGE